MTARIPRIAALAATLGAVVAFPASAPAAVHGLRTGFTDGAAFDFSSGADRQLEMRRARGAGASIIRIGMSWADTSPTKPPSLAVERDPSWAGYNWTDTDSEVRERPRPG